MEEAPTSNNGMNTSNNGMSTSNKINLSGLGVGAIVLSTVYTAVLASQLMATKHKVDYLYYKELTQNKWLIIDGAFSPFFYLYKTEFELTCPVS